MYRELISSLTYMYSTMCRAKGLVPDKQLQNIAVGAHSLHATCGTLAAQNAESLTKTDKALLEEAEFIDNQIEEAYVFLFSLELN